MCVRMAQCVLIALLVLVSGSSGSAAPPETPFEKGDGWQTTDYPTAVKYYQNLAASSSRVTISEVGATDSGRPLHVVLISRDGIPLNEVLRDDRTVLLINNAIHPGESDGVDASMALARDIAFDNERYGDVLKNVIVAVIPLYNIGGALNRNTGTRANQNGPREYGFRGNAQNYDLNRDFIKCDTLNAQSFATVFHQLDPDLLIDTHVSNGADYQHVMTTAHSQKDKLGLQLGVYLEETLQPALFGKMKQNGFPTVPYINSGGRPPEEGFAQFLELPRYSTGYAALFQTMGFMTETHMLKPYAQRVQATREFIDQSLQFLATEGKTIQTLRQQDRDAYHQQADVPIAWSVDRNSPSRLEFHGYEAEYQDSKVTSGKRLFYNRSKPFVRNIPFYNNYRASKTVKLPAGYLIPQGWRSVVKLLKLNGVTMTKVQQPVELDGEVYRIEDVETKTAPFEGHYYHDDVQLSSKTQPVVAQPGDLIVPIKEDKARYVVEVLEPESMDSLFRWNFFDTILQQKEHFSPYVFEDTAAELLATDQQLKSEFEQRKADDEAFASDRYAQLNFLYKRSKHYEKSHLRYPIVRLLSLPEDLK